MTQKGPMTHYFLTNNTKNLTRLNHLLFNTTSIIISIVIILIKDFYLAYCLLNLLNFGRYLDLDYNSGYTVFGFYF